MPWLREVPPDGIEPRQWHVVFHRKADHLFFRLIALGRFKHVSAIAWIPELQQWWVYDVGFRRTRMRIFEHGPTAERAIGAIIRDNIVVTMDVRGDDLPWMRLGMFCTTSVAHLLGVRCGSLRPDAFYRKLISLGGSVRNHAVEHTNPCGGSEPGDRTAASPAATGCVAANANPV